MACDRNSGIAPGDLLQFRYATAGDITLLAELNAHALTVVYGGPPADQDPTCREES